MHSPFLLRVVLAGEGATFTIQMRFAAYATLFP